MASEVTEKGIVWGISKDLQSDIRFEPNACKLYVMDISLGCPMQCVYCLFSPLELMVYKLQNPGYKGDILPLKLDKFMRRTEFPPVVYLCYSSDPLGNEELTASTLRVLEKLFANNVHVLLLSKGLFSNHMIDMVKKRPDLMEIQVGLTNFDNKRNKVIEPGAPSYEARMENIEKLGRIEGLRSLVVRMDPMFPGIDDTDENITRIMDDASQRGVKRAVMSYLVLPQSMKLTLSKNDFLADAVAAVSEITPTISEQELYSFPFEEKIAKFSHFEELCRERGIQMSVCGCKEHRFKETKFGWTCFPFFSKEKRDELSRDFDIKLDTSHLKCHDLTLE